MSVWRGRGPALMFVAALGGAVAILGGAFLGSGPTAGAVAAVVLGLATLAALWRLYVDARFDDADYGPADTVEDAGRDRRGAYAGAHVLMIAGTVTAAVGARLVLAHPWDTAGTAAVAAVLGGPALYLVGDLALARAAAGRAPVSRAIALAALALVALIGFVLPVLVLAALAFAVLLLLSLSASGWFRLPSVSVRD